MTNVIQFDPTRVKRAAHIAEGSGETVSYTHLTLPTICSV